MKAGRKMNRNPHRLARRNRDLAGGDTDAHCHFQIFYGRDDFEARAQALSGGVFTSDRKAEVAHDAVVTLRVVGNAAMARDDFSAAGVVSRQQVAVLFGAQAAQVPGRIHEVVGHHRDLADAVFLAGCIAFASQRMVPVAIQHHVERSLAGWAVAASLSPGSAHRLAEREAIG
ncbi:MAG: hypothetical protein M3Y67_04040, partial [Pseudomonadota bacterium]|nr:hypothetical protein [Pseudomonadota bacterium]